MRNKQSGFTLIEIAIVLVIIGLLLGGVLKGQELINQAKIKNIANDLNGISAGVYAYQDRYKAFPGDDSNAFTRWTALGTAPATGLGDGQVAGEFTSNTDTDESRIFWRELRLSGLVSGDTASYTQPQNAVGGMVGVQMNAGVPTTGVVLSGLVTCTSNIPGKLAEALDNQLDDGKPTGGSVKGFTQTGIVTPGVATNPTRSAPATAYVDDGVTLYAVCKTL